MVPATMPALVPSTLGASLCATVVWNGVSRGSSVSAVSVFRVLAGASFWWALCAARISPVSASAIDERGRRRRRQRAARRRGGVDHEAGLAELRAAEHVVGHRGRRAARMQGSRENGSGHREPRVM